MYGEKGVEVVIKELKQLHNRMVTKPKHMDNLNEKDKQNAL